MTIEEETALRDEQEGLEKEERELEDAAETFSESEGNPEEEAADIQADIARTEKEETAEHNQQILTTLGFKRYEDPGVIKYNIRVMGDKIGVTFNETNPLGKIWAYKVPEGDEDKVFLKNGELAEHSLIQKYRAIQEDKEPIPEISVAGEITEKRGKAIKVEITENGEKREIFYGLGAVKKDKEGKYFIPAGFSKGGKDKEGQERDAKMNLPRDIQLPDYLIQLSQAPTADATKEQEEGKAEVKLTDKTTLAEALHKEPITLTEGEKPTVDYYVNLIGEITEKVGTEERIAAKEQGYAINMVFNAITRDTRTALIAELKSGGNQGE